MDGYDIIIVGGGVAAFAAAMYAGRMNMKTLVLADKVGGTIILTNHVENYPGFNKISGLELSEKLKNHAMEYDIKLIEERVTSAAKEGILFKLKTEKDVYAAKSVIFATGATWRELKVPGHDEFKNKGVHYCALCDGFFYKDKRAVVVGGSDSAVIEALHLAEVCKEVFIVYRKDKFTRPEPINLERMKKTPNIKAIFETNVVEIKGDDKGVTAVVFDKEYEGSKEFATDAAFIAIGAIPNSQLAKELGVALDAKGQIPISRESATNVAGVYAAGDVTDSGFKQAITGVAEGVNAVYYAFEHIKKTELEK